jgi:hypothetical protein
LASAPVLSEAFHWGLPSDKVAGYHTLEVKCTVFRASHLDFLWCISISISTSMSISIYLSKSAKSTVVFGNVREDNWSHWICIKSINFLSHNRCPRARSQLQQHRLDRTEKFDWSQIQLYIYNPMKLVYTTNICSIPSCLFLFFSFYHFFSILKFCFHL